jgi:hypothetical protein
MSRQIFETRLPTEQGIKRLERAKRLIQEVAPMVEPCATCGTDDDTFLYFTPITPDSFARPLRCWIQCVKCGDRSEVRAGPELTIFNWNMRQKEILILRTGENISEGSAIEG